MYPNSIYFGLQVVPIEVCCGQSIYHLATWTFGGRDLVASDAEASLVGSVFFCFFVVFQKGALVLNPCTGVLPSLSA